MLGLDSLSVELHSVMRSLMEQSEKLDHASGEVWGWILNQTEQSSDNMLRAALAVAEKAEGGLP